MLGNPQTDTAIIVTQWTAVDDLKASQAPEAILAHVERLGVLMVEASQTVYQVLVQL